MNVRVSIVIAIGAKLVQLWKHVALDAEALVVGQVPVEDIQFHRFHSVECALYDRYRHPVAGDVQQEASPGKARLVINVKRRGFEAGVGRRNQLQKCLEAMQRAYDTGGLKAGLLGRDIQGVGFVLAEVIGLVDRFRAIDQQRGFRRESGPHRISGLAREFTDHARRASLEPPYWFRGETNGKTAVNFECAGCEFDVLRHGHEVEIRLRRTERRDS